LGKTQEEEEKSKSSIGHPTRATKITELQYRKKGKFERLLKSKLSPEISLLGEERLTNKKGSPKKRKRTLLVENLLGRFKMTAPRFSHEKRREKT